jgi:hypothetical protein
MVMGFEVVLRILLPLGEVSLVIIDLALPLPAGEVRAFHVGLVMLLTPREVGVVFLPMFFVVTVVLCAHRVTSWSPPVFPTFRPFNHPVWRPTGWNTLSS